MTNNVQDKKIYWQTRRGVLELDFVLQNFWHDYGSHMGVEQKNLFSKLLTCQDPELLAYLVYRSSKPIDQDCLAMVGTILQHIDSK
ncbi:MAG: hypothetical protein HON55_00205 [Legionellales bacterium]|jgi:antitoxin CptB|nr:hypothetical protein [Legionellales bacterium]